MSSSGPKTGANFVDTYLGSQIPPPSQQQMARGYGASPESQLQHQLPGTSAASEFGTNPASASVMSQTAASRNGKFNEEWDASQRGSSIIDGGNNNLNRSASAMSQHDTTTLPSRSGTLKKKPSLKRGNSLKRSGSKRSSRAGSVRSLALNPEAHDEVHSAFYSPVPTTGNPTDVLANRFTAWRKVLKDLITYFREIQSQYEQRGKTLLKLANVINNISTPIMFIKSGGIDDALPILRQFHKDSIAAANKSREIENDVILALTGLRSDLQQKIKEIKNLSGDFKNSVDKEMDATRRAVQHLGDALGQSDVDSASTTGKQDPYLLRLAVDRQVERQIDEENYLHQAYLNLETSGRELESIVVGEIQKSYNAYAGILKREGEEALNTVEDLRNGPIAMPKDTEWNKFIESDEHFIDPRVSIRNAQHIHYPGRDHELASEVRAGLLERKSKYLKSYTAGWYVLSPTHLHEFKSADKTQAPIMSLYLPEQKLGSHSNEGGSSNKFMLKGRQTGSMHRGHSWVFRAESFDTMLAWYEDIKTLTESTGQERTAFVRQHARSVSGGSYKAGSVSSDGAIDDDEEDEEPFAASNEVAASSRTDVSKRPQAGGRFPSDLQVNASRGLEVPLSPSSGSSGFGEQQDHKVIEAAADLPGSGIGEHYPEQRYGDNAIKQTHASKLNHYAEEDGVNPYTSEPIQGQEGVYNNTRGADGGEMVAAMRRDRQASEAPELANSSHNEDLSNYALASHEAAQIAAHDANFIQQSAPTNVNDTAFQARNNDSPLRDATAKPSLVSGDRRQGGLSALDTGIQAPRPMQYQPSSFSNTSGLGSYTNTDAATKTAGPASELSADDDLESVNTEAEQIGQRPTLTAILSAGQHHQSVASASQLHVPGEYPRNSSTT